jgi:hypothetical protein
MLVVVSNYFSFKLQVSQNSIQLQFVTHRLMSSTQFLRVGAMPQTRTRISEQSMEARNRVGIGLSYRPAWLLRLAESIDSWALLKV